jgi:thiamine biosynthesis lipoprotein ApbE
VENDILAVTAVSSTATRADIFAKTALILGQDEGLKFIDGKEDSACIMFFKNGEIKFSKRASEYL